MQNLNFAESFSSPQLAQRGVKPPYIGAITLVPMTILYPFQMFSLQDQLLTRKHSSESLPLVAGSPIIRLVLILNF